MGGIIKENLLVSQYVIKAKTIACHLAFVGERINDKDLILYLVSDIGSRY